MALDFYLTYFRYVLVQVRDDKLNDFSDHRYISASIMMGMWSSMRELVEYEDFKVVDRDYSDRFMINRHNIFALLTREKIESLVPSIFR